MEDRTCSVEGCEREVQARGWCRKHYDRWRKWGTTDLPVRTCDVVGCEEKHFGRGFCYRHYLDTQKTGKPLGRPRISNPRYEAMHRRVKVARGSASEHTCVDCGKPAEDWSYNGCGGEAERVQYVRDKWWMAFSLNITDYDPRCKPCHAAFDARG